MEQVLFGWHQKEKQKLNQFEVWIALSSEWIRLNFEWFSAFRTTNLQIQTFLWYLVDFVGCMNVILIVKEIALHRCPCVCVSVSITYIFLVNNSQTIWIEQTNRCLCSLPWHFGSFMLCFLIGQEHLGKYDRDMYFGNGRHLVFVSGMHSSKWWILSISFQIIWFFIYVSDGPKENWYHYDWVWWKMSKLKVYVRCIHCFNILEHSSTLIIVVMSHWQSSFNEISKTSSGFIESVLSCLSHGFIWIKARAIMVLPM